MSPGAAQLIRLWLLRLRVGILGRVRLDLGVIAVRALRCGLHRLYVRRLWGELPAAVHDPCLSYRQLIAGRAAGPPEPIPANFLWVVVPDIVADAHGTYTRFEELAPAMADLPLAYAVQDGTGDVGIPFHDPALRCLFLAGSDAYKLSSEMADIAREGKARGLWIHGGRCNSATRARHFAAVGCDSFDGSGASKFPKLIPRYLQWASEATLCS